MYRRHLALAFHGSLITAPVAVVNFMNYKAWEWGKIAASDTCVMLPVLIFSFVVRKYMTAGLSAGAVKE